MDLKDNNKKVAKNKNFFESFKHAFTGIRTVIEEERNMNSRVSFVGLAILISLYLNVSPIEWVFIIFSIMLVFIVEIINTSFENLVDLVTNCEYHDIAKKVKDMAAGAVLLSAILALVVACFILLPKIWQLIA